jgi:Holliday junction resolvase
VSRGIDRERQVKRLLEQDGWWTCRAAGSFGDADLVALRDGHRPRLIEVKSTTTPYAHFRPADRLALLEAATVAGAAAELAYWPSRGTLEWIPADQWPPATKPSTN